MKQFFFSLAIGSVLVGGAVAVRSAGFSQARTEQESKPRVIRITAERFTFTPSEIKLDAGETVELRFKSDDTVHGFRILDSETDLAIPKRGQGEVSHIFRAEKAGRYTFECSRMCGAGHGFMRGVIIVRDPKEPK